MNPLTKLTRVARVGYLVTLALALPLTAAGAVRREGTWPADEKKVSLDFDGKPSAGLEKLASEAGWSLVVSKGITPGEHDVRIAVEDQPADAVLEALFAESRVVARRSGTLVSLYKDESTPAASSAAAPLPLAPPPAPAAPPPTLPPPPSSGAGAGAAEPPPAPPIPAVRGEDRNVVGASVEIGKDEVVHTLTVTGGSTKIRGTVTGDLVVAGGSAEILDGGRVIGDATVFGGSLRVRSGARIDGHAGTVGGVLKRDDGAVIGGSIVEAGPEGRGDIGVHVTDGKEGKHAAKEEPARTGETAQSIGHGVTKMSLLFVLGCILLSLATRKMESLQQIAAARPMKAFASGILTSLLAFAAVVAACITVVGIPFAVLGLIVAVIAVYGSMTAVLTTLGAALVRHKTTNVYLHLLLGCGVFLAVSAVPYVGGIITFGLVMIAIGTLALSRLGAAPPARPELV